METLLLLGAGAGIAALVLGAKKKTPQQEFIDTATPAEKKIMKEEVERVEKLIENKQKDKDGNTFVYKGSAQKEENKKKKSYQWNDPRGPLNSQERQEVKNILAKGQCIVSEDPGAPRLTVVGWDARQKRIDRELRSHGWTSHSEPVSFGGGATPISFMQKVWMCPPGKWKGGKGK